MSSTNRFLATVVVVLCLTDGGLFKKIPDYINVCKRDPKTIDECVLNSINALKPKLLSGIPELNVPPIDPLIIPEIVALDSGNNQLRAVGKNVKVTGGSDFIVKSLVVDLDSMTFRVRVRFPKLHFNGEYKLDTKILVLSLNGQGTLVADAVKCDAEITMKAETYVKDDVKYLKFTSVKSDINIKDYTIKLEGLFNGDKVLGQAANEAINQNRGEFLKATKPTLENTVSQMLLRVSNNVVEDLPLDELLPKP